MNAAIEAIVVEGRRLVTCCDCGATLAQFRIKIIAPKRCAGILLWSTPTHNAGAKTCASRSVREALHE